MVIYFFQGLDIEALSAALTDGDTIQNLIEIHRSFIKSVVKFKPGEMGIITNGRIFGPFDEEEAFVVDDFSLLDRFCFNSYGDKILSVFKKEKSNLGAGESRTPEILRSYKLRHFVFFFQMGKERSS